jgi:hypothetical protein
MNWVGVTKDLPAPQASYQNRIQQDSVALADLTPLTALRFRPLLRLVLLRPKNLAKKKSAAGYRLDVDKTIGAWAVTAPYEFHRHHTFALRLRFVSPDPHAT